MVYERAELTNMVKRDRVFKNPKKPVKPQKLNTVTAAMDVRICLLYMCECVLAKYACMILRLVSICCVLLFAGSVA